VLRGVDLRVGAGEVVALMGRNGAGKTTLLATCAGLLRPTGGRVRLAGSAPADLRPRALARAVGWVPQVPGDLLVAATVAQECQACDRDSRLAPGSAAVVLQALAPGLAAARGGAHPRDLSEGERLSLALAVVVAAGPPLLLLDEPTRGLDYAAKDRLCAQLAHLAAAGHAVVVATHDVELAAEVADRTVVLADGEVVAAGPSRDIVTDSPAFAPQVAKILSPGRWLTVADVRRALDQVPA
jgi:energy-coupling factor transport system ATP-binding protein